MKKQISIAFLTAFLSTTIFAAPPTEKTFAGELPVGVSDMLDKLSSGGVGHVFIKKICDNKSEDVTLSEIRNQIHSTFKTNLNEKQSKVAKVYLENAISDKMKAFRFTYSNKSCEDLANLKTISKYYGFV